MVLDSALSLLIDFVIVCYVVRVQFVLTNTVRFQMKAEKYFQKTSNFVDYLSTIYVDLLSPCEDLPYLHMDEQYEIKVKYKL